MILYNEKVMDNFASPIGLGEVLYKLPAYKMHCFILTEKTNKTAVKSYYKKDRIEFNHLHFSDSNNCEFRGI